MRPFSPPLARLIAARHGVVSLSELLADGFSTTTIRRMVSARVLIRIHQGVYRLGVHRDSFESKCAAACIAAPDGVVTGSGAGSLWSFRHVDRPAVPTT